MENDPLTLNDSSKGCTLFIIDFGQHVFEAGIDKFKLALQVGFFNQFLKH